MRKDRAVLFVLALTLTGCNWLSLAVRLPILPGTMGATLLRPYLRQVAHAMSFHILQHAPHSASSPMHKSSR